MRSRIRLKKQLKIDPRKFSKAHPIPPRSLIRVRDDNPGPHRALASQLLRVGFYRKTDGFNVIWIVYANGEYGETTNHTYFNRHFMVLKETSETDLYGTYRPSLQAFY